jgi:cytoskeletal protein CcmA (bactofilin family)
MPLTKLLALAVGEAGMLARASRGVIGLVVPKARGAGATQPSVVGEGAEVSGSLFCDGDVRIDGHVAGDVSGRKVAVGVNGRVLGRIVADEAMVSGSVSGGIAAHIVVLTGTARVACGIMQEHLTIEAGAVVSGLLERPDMRAPRPERRIDEHEAVTIERVMWTRSSPERWMPRATAAVRAAAE